MTSEIIAGGVPDLNIRVAEEIRVFMTRRRISGRQLAEALGVSQTWVSVRLNGTQAIGLDDLSRIAGVLNVHVRVLLPDEIWRTDAPAYVPRRQPTIALTGRPVDTRPGGHPGGSRAPVGPGRTGRTGRVIQPVSA